METTVSDQHVDRRTAPGRPLSPLERRQRNRQEMLDAILVHACEIMRQDGVAALSLRELARRLRFTVQALYKYYPSKAALYDAVFLEGIRTFASYWDAALASHLSFWEQLQAGIEASMRFAHDHPELNDLTFSRPVPGFVPSETSMQESRRMLDAFDRVIEQAVTRGEIRTDVSRTEVRDLYLAMLDGLTRQHVANDPDTPVGSGRYGRLVPAAIAVLRSAWHPASPAPSPPPIQHPRHTRRGRPRRAST
jgi:AcrR family transcriptional regulator